jgi:hypothetical protein
MHVVSSLLERQQRVVIDGQSSDRMASFYIRCTSGVYPWAPSLSGIHKRSTMAYTEDNLPIIALYAHDSC